MTIQIPTTSELRDNIVANIEASISQTVPLLPKSFIRVLATVLAAVLVVLYKYGGFIFQQIFVETASFSQTTINGAPVVPLIEWGRLVGVGDPDLATQAEVTIDLTVNSVGSGSLPAGTQFLHAPSGVVYVTIASTPLVVGTVNVDVRAASDSAGGDGSGSQGNREIGDILSAVSPLPGIIQDAPVTGTITTGVNAETEEAYRQRIIDRFQFRPQGGAYADYQQWSVEVAGIINAYPYTSTIPGYVDVYCECSSDIEPDGIPPQALLDDVQNSINFDEDGRATRRPASAYSTVLPITRTGFDVTVINLVVNDQPSVEAEIQRALEQYFFQLEPYILGVTLPPRRDRITVIGVLAIVQEIVSANGGVFDDAFLEIGGNLVTDIFLTEGEKAKLLSLTFTTIP